MVATGVGTDDAGVGDAVGAGVGVVTATAVAVLSTRARAGAPVSMPIHWKDVSRGLEPRKYTLRSAPGLLRKSKPWEGYAAAARPLSGAIRKLTQAGKPRKVSRTRR